MSWLRKPQFERRWYPKYGTQADTHLNVDGTVTIDKVRNFTYTRSGTETQEWVPKVRVNPKEIKKLWYLLEPFNGLEAVAHPYFIFEFNDGSTLCFTIEGKRPDGEPYSGLDGLLNEYELGYIWITMHDCITMPLTHNAEALYLYPLALSSDIAQGFFMEITRKSHELFEKPEFYNTLCNTCTTGMYQAFNRANPGMFPFDWSWIFPGYSDRFLLKRGIIVGKGDYKQMRAQRNLMQKQDALWDLVDLPPPPFSQAVFKLVPF
jgi:hypothetical protein